MRRLQGFTLIELMVTITIIGILASIIYVSFGEARTNSRNKSMTVELKEMQLALETYRSQNGVYPLPEQGCDGLAVMPLPAGQLVARSDGTSSWCPNNYFNTNTGRQNPLLVPEFLPAALKSTEAALGRLYRSS